MRKLSLVFIALLTMAGGTRQTAASNLFSDIVVFGDSLSDAGNVLITTTASPTHQPDPPPTFGYYNGRATNGPNWVDQLAASLGLPAPTASEAGGMNYAWAGAKTGIGTNARFPSPTFPPNPTLDVQRVGTQIESFLTDRGSFLGTELVTLWVGANDLRDATTPADILPIVGNLEQHIRTLDQNGARNVLVPNQLDLSLIPFFGLPGTPDPSSVLAGVLFFNSQLDARLNLLDSDPTLSVNIFRTDMFGLSQAILSDPAAFGLTNLSDPALNFVTGTVVPNPDEYLFWDFVHPTTAAHGIIAETAREAVVPVPTTLALLGSGLAAVGFVRRRLSQSSAKNTKG